MDLLSDVSLGELTEDRFSDENRPPFSMGTGYIVDLWLDTTTQKHVVVKSLFKRTLAQRKQWRRSQGDHMVCQNLLTRYLPGVRNLARLQPHTNMVEIVLVTESFVMADDHDYGSIFIVQEFCAKGPTLKLVELQSRHYFQAPSSTSGLDSNGRIRRPFSPDRARQMFFEVAQALQHIHAQGFIHGDVKPTNVFLTADNVAKLGDFDLLREDSKIESEHQASVYWEGTRQFRPPEAFVSSLTKASSYNGKAADLWALGVTLWCWLFGFMPFESITDSERIADEIVAFDVLKAMGSELEFATEPAFQFEDSLGDGGDPLGDSPESMRAKPLQELCPSDLKCLLLTLLHPCPERRKLDLKVPHVSDN